MSCTKTTCSFYNKYAKPTIKVGGVNTSKCSDNFQESHKIFWVHDFVSNLNNPFHAVH